MTRCTSCKRLIGLWVPALGWMNTEDFGLIVDEHEMNFIILFDTLFDPFDT